GAASAPAPPEPCRRRGRTSPEPPAASAPCPACGHRSERVHGQYVRTLRDLPAWGRPVRVRLRVRRFVCRTEGCARRTFIEQGAGAPPPGGRARVRREAVREAFCAALGGEAGARLAARIGTAAALQTE